MKKLLQALAGAILCALFAGGIGVQAAPAVMSDGQIFDAAYYAAQNPDVAAALGTDAETLYRHYTEFGKKEGRAPYDLSKSAEEIQQEILAAQKQAAIEADAKVRPAGYDAAASLRTYLGKSVKDADIQAMIDTVHNLTPAPVSSYTTYDFGNGKTFTLGPELAMALMKTNADGTYALDSETGTYVPDEDKVKAFASWIARQSGTSKDTGVFHTTSGRDLKLAGGFTNHPVTDTDAEASYLMGVLTTMGARTHTPEKKGSTTYIEVDMAEQKAYYYEKGKLLWSSDIVTGNMARGMGTPSGVYKIRAKMRSIYLTGANYSSYVDYWMPFIENRIGLHDASWRSNFGGSIYKTSGSHGCVNLPPAKAKELYDLISVGTYVITFY
ncbi:MAG: L,D-transpeptidase [Lachnospiraceae bacterium]